MGLVRGCGSTGGSGCVVVVPLCLLAHGEHFGAKIIVIGTLLRELWSFKSNVEKN
jgi:hypothetical protein